MTNSIEDKPTGIRDNSSRAEWAMLKQLQSMNAEIVMLRQTVIEMSGEIKSISEKLEKINSDTGSDGK